MTSQQPSNFTQWLLSFYGIARRRFIWPAITAAISIITAACKSIVPSDARAIFGVLSVIHVFAITSLLLLLLLPKLRGRNRFYETPFDDKIWNSLGYKNIKKWEEGKKNAILSREKFQNFWCLLWFAWWIFYVALGVANLLPDRSSPMMPIFGIIADIFHAIALFMFVLCYLSLSMPARIGKGKVDGANLNWAPWTILFLLMLSVQVMATFLFEYGSNLFSEMPVTPGELSMAAGLLQSAIGGVAFAMLNRRLDSKFLKTPDWFVTMMYLYAIIHITYPLFKLPGFAPFAPIVIGLALIFKVVLFLFISWADSSGRLLFHLMKVQQVREEEDRDWDKFQPTISPDM